MPVAVQTLYEKLGGAPAVKTVVEGFYKKVLADDQLKGYFANTDMNKQIESQIKFLSMALGGPNEYNGKPMKEAHEGMGITDLHFDLVAGHLVDTLKGAGVPQPEINAVVELVGPLKGQIVSA